jgi:quinol---cytochrome-c reductase cytochrome c subunit
VVVAVRGVVRRLLVLVAFALAAPSAAAAQGEDLYAESCLTCHGVRGQGVPGRGPRLTSVGPLGADFYLRTGYMPLESPHDQPARGKSPFTASQINSLVAYVASLGKGPAVPAPHAERGNVSAGLRLFTQHCAGCHQVVGEGGYVTGARVPPLKDATPVQVAEAVRLGPYLMPRFPRTQLSDAELDSIIAYVEESKHPDDRGGWGIGHLGPVPEGLVAWLLAGAALVAVCSVIGKRIES